METLPELPVAKSTTAVQMIILGTSILNEEYPSDSRLRTLTPPPVRLDLVAALPLDVAEPLSPPPTEAMEEGSQERERSLTPMELSSAASSPVLSPHVAPPDHALPNAEKTTSSPWSPPGLFLTTTSALTPPTSDVHISPMQLSPDSGDPPGLSLSFFPSTSPQPSVAAEEPPALPVKRAQDHVPDEDFNRVPGADVAAFAAEQARASESLSDHIPKDPGSSAPTPAPYKPKRKPVPNPFVSGGFVTDFVSVTPQKSLKSLPEETQKVQALDDADVSNYLYAGDHFQLTQNFAGYSRSLPYHQSLLDPLHYHHRIPHDLLAHQAHL